MSTYSYLSCFYCGLPALTERGNQEHEQRHVASFQCRDVTCRGRRWETAREARSHHSLHGVKKVTHPPRALATGPPLICRWSPSVVLRRFVSPMAEDEQTGEPTTDAAGQPMETMETEGTEPSAAADELFPELEAAMGLLDIEGSDIQRQLLREIQDALQAVMDRLALLDALVTA